jgi:hypothetical protein
MGSINADRLNEPPDWHTHRTLGQMNALGWRLSTWCTNCGLSAPADIDRLIELRGSESSPWDRFIVCDYRNCRGRAVFKVATGPAELWFRLTRNWTRGT